METIQAAQNIKADLQAKAENKVDISSQKNIALA